MCLLVTFMIPRLVHLRPVRLMQWLGTGFKPATMGLLVGSLLGVDGGGVDNDDTKDLVV